jgi:F-type H+-transporting ATPase subunit a
MRYRAGIIWLLILLLTTVFQLKADNQHNTQGDELNVREFILHHLADSYEWQLTVISHKPVTIPLPVILYSQYSGWNIFLSSEFHKNPVYKDFTIAHEGKYKGKIVELHGAGSVLRPFDISITKTAFALIFNSLLLMLLIMYVARTYKRKGYGPKNGLAGFMEMLIMSIHDDVIKPCVGKHYRFYAPYLLTVFFFIFLNNLMGLIPLFPGGVNVTGNIAVTMVLALFIFLLTNAYGTKEYWKEIFWPDVPLWLKVPFPLMPIVEIVGLFTKPFALMIRLFANMLAGHAIILGLASLIFVSVKLGAAVNAQMTIVSILLSIFIDMMEILVAFIQAYVFTLLSSVFIGLSRVEPHYK